MPHPSPARLAQRWLQADQFHIKGPRKGGLGTNPEEMSWGLYDENGEGRGYILITPRMDTRIKKFIDQAGNTRLREERFADRTIWYVGQVVVDPKVRRRGLATRLYDAAYKWVKQQGGVLWAGDYNEMSGSYWRKLVEQGKATQVPYMRDRPKFFRTRLGSYEEQRQAILDWVDSHGDPLTLYREVYVNDLGDINTQSLGRFWTPDKKKAHSPHGYLDTPTAMPVIIEAQVDRRHVDEMETVATMRRYPSEREVRLLPGSPVTIKGYWTPDGHVRDHARGKAASVKMVVRSTSRTTKITIPHDDPKMGDLGWVILERAGKNRWGRGRCADDIQALLNDLPGASVYHVADSYLDADHRGWGLGRDMYEKALKALHPVVIYPDDCVGDGTTTRDAKRVWWSLRRDYPSSGSAIASGSEAKQQTLEIRTRKGGGSWYGAELWAHNPADPTDEWVVGGVFAKQEPYLTEPDCAEDLANLKEQHGDLPIWVVAKSNLEPDLIGKGWGKRLYHALFDELLAKEGRMYVSGHLCADGATSPMARRVWRSLRKHYPGEGLIVALVKPSPSRVARHVQARPSQRIKDAIEESMANLPEQVRWDMERFAKLVMMGEAPALEKHTSVMYKAFAPLRRALGSVTMYRGEPKDPPKIKRKWLSWSTSRNIASHFANDRDHHIIEAKIAAKDVVAAILSPHNENYIEYLVLDRPKYHQPSPSQIPLYYSVMMSESDDPLPEHLNPWDDSPEIREARFPNWRGWLQDAQRTIERAGGMVLKLHEPTDDRNPTVSYILPPDVEPPPSVRDPWSSGTPVPEYLGKVAGAGTYKGVKFFLMDSLGAHDRLNPFVGPWVFHNDGSAKRQLMQAYRDLPERKKAALAFEVAQAMSGPTVVYRWLREGDSPTKMGGASVTDDPKALGYGSNVHAFRVKPDDVMLHYKQDESWLASKRYGHEREMILKPDARPQHLGQFDTETQQIMRLARRWLRRAAQPGNLGERMFAIDTHLSYEAKNWNHNLAHFLTMWERTQRTRPHKIERLTRNFDPLDWLRRGTTTLPSGVSAIEEIRAHDPRLAQDIEAFLKVRRTAALDAHKSIDGTPWERIRVPGLGTLTTEPPDTEDSFPPAIASYATVDGWLVYHGRNGSIGVVVGTRAELDQWMRQVEAALDLTPQKESRPWTPEDGGARYVAEAKKVAERVLRALGARAEVKAFVEERSDTWGEVTGSELRLVNVHKPTNRATYIGGIKPPSHLQVAAHEAAHLGFNRGGRPVLEAIREHRKQGGDYLSGYHSLAGDFEGVMEAASLYALAPEQFKDAAPIVYEATRKWFGGKTIRTAAYDPESWYYSYEPGTPLQTVIDRWQKDRPGLDRRGNPLPRQKVYNDSMPVMLTVRELWPLREYTWTREISRGGFAKVNGKSVQLPGPLKWDAIKEDMRLRGWDPNDPLLLEIGSEGGVKVGEGNHRLAIARELGIRQVPVEFQFKSYRVRKNPQTRLPATEVSPKALKNVVEKEVERVEKEAPRAPRSPEEEAEIERRVDELMKLLGM